MRALNEGRTNGEIVNDQVVKNQWGSIGTVVGSPELDEQAMWAMGPHIRSTEGNQLVGLLWAAT